MTDQTAKLAILEEELTEKDCFVRRLAAYCSQYVMEIAKPVMEHASELYEDKAIVKLVNMWHEADREYEHRRRSYLVQWHADKENDYGFQPLESYKWTDERRRAYRQTLDALLIR